MPTEPGAGALAVGDVVGPVEVGPVAHGGHCVARHDGRVIFVRHALPGEQVTVRLTDVSKPSFWRGDVAEVLSASSDRVDAPCAIAGTCGGCDFQHVSLDGQRGLKSAVLAEQLQRLAGLELDVRVEPVLLPGSQVDDGLGWRTRVHYRIDRESRQLALLGHRSHRTEVLPEEGCLIASASPDRAELQGIADATGADDLEVVVADPVAVLADGAVVEGSSVVEHTVLGRRYEVRADGFWQVHPAAAETLAAQMLEWLEPRAGERALDLYCGVGLFAGALVDRGARVTGVEIARSAIDLARRNVPEARFIAGSLDRSLRRLPGATDLVVLDPPRAGAGRKVVEHVAGLRPRAVVHIGCDPASFARDLGLFQGVGYRVEQVRAFDLFPMTHHFESMALLVPTERS